MLLTDDATFATEKVPASSEQFVDNGTLHHTQYVHRVTTAVLLSQHSYTYQMSIASSGSPSLSSRSHGATGACLSSPPLHFRARLRGPGDVARLAVFGDFGLVNPVSFPGLLADARARHLDAIVHVGDFAYDMYADNATMGDEWFNFVEPVYSPVPVMTCIGVPFFLFVGRCPLAWLFLYCWALVTSGNHEGMYNALNYRKRFSMPSREDTDNLFYSFDFGPTHYIAYSNEFYFTGTRP